MHYSTITKYSECGIRWTLSLRSDNVQRIIARTYIWFLYCTELTLSVCVINSIPQELCKLHSQRTMRTYYLWTLQPGYNAHVKRVEVFLPDVTANARGAVIWSKIHWHELLVTSANTSTCTRDCIALWKGSLYQKNEYLLTLLTEAFFPERGAVTGTGILCSWT